MVLKLVKPAFEAYFVPLWGFFRVFVPEIVIITIAHWVQHSSKFYELEDANAFHGLVNPSGLCGRIWKGSASKHQHQRSWWSGNGYVSGAQCLKGQASWLTRWLIGIWRLMSPRMMVSSHNANSIQCFRRDVYKVLRERKRRSRSWEGKVSAFVWNWELNPASSEKSRRRFSRDQQRLPGISPKSGCFLGAKDWNRSCDPLHTERRPVEAEDGCVTSLGDFEDPWWRWV